MVEILKQVTAGDGSNKNDDDEESNNDPVATEPTLLPHDQQQESSSSQTTTTTTTTKLSRAQRHVLGISLALAAALFSTLNSVLSQIVLANGVSVLQLTGIRQILPAILLSIWLVYTKQNPVSLAILNVHGLTLTVRSIFNLIAGAALAFALTKIAVGDATSLKSTSPVFVAVLAHFLLPRERYSKMYFVTTLFLLAGCVLIARPSMLFGDTNTSVTSSTSPSEANRLEGVGAAIVGAVCIAITMIATRLERRVSTPVTLFYNNVVGLVLVYGFALIFRYAIVPDVVLHQTGKWSRDVIIIFVIICSLAGMTSQLFMVAATKFEDASIVSLLTTSDVLWSFCAQMLILKVLPPALTLVGAALIVGSVVFLGVQIVITTAKNKAKKKNTTKQIPAETELN